MNEAARFIDAPAISYVATTVFLSNSCSWNKIDHPPELTVNVGLAYTNQNGMLFSNPSSEVISLTVTYPFCGILYVVFTEDIESSLNPGTATLRGLSPML
jgi:hypothetical protein